ncbi:amidase, partial [Streptomyces fradiae]
MNAPPRTPADAAEPADPPIYTSAYELSARIRNKELSAVEVTEAVLARLEAVNPRLHAVVAV